MINTALDKVWNKFNRNNDTLLSQQTKRKQHEGLEKFRRVQKREQERSFILLLLFCFFSQPQVSNLF